MKKPTSIWLLIYPDTSLTALACAERILKVFESEDVLFPSSCGPDEQTRKSYHRPQILEQARTHEAFHMFLFRHNIIKYDCYLYYEKLPYFYCNFDKSMTASQWQTVRRFADQLAEALHPRLAILHISRSMHLSWSNEEEKTQRWMTFATQHIPVKFRETGPTGLGLITYFGGDILDMFGEKLLLSTPGIAKKLDWGGIRIDLFKDAWNTDVASFALAAKQARDHLSPAQAIADPVFNKDMRTVTFRSSPAWLKKQKHPSL